MTTPAKKPLFLSASRIDTFQTCSQLYAARYIHHLPDSGNDGSRRGSVVHEVLELLLKPRHRRHYDAAMAAKTCTTVPALWRLILRLAAKHGVTQGQPTRLTLGGKPKSSSNLTMIDSFIMVALGDEFFGPAGTEEIHGEKPFEIEVNEGGKRYRLKGFIDKAFTIRDKQGLMVRVVDYKSSKAKFDGEKVEFNYQSLAYQLAAKRKLFPHIGRRDFHFLFLKFPRKPRQDQATFTDEQLSGYEWHLTDLQAEVEAFDLTKATSNLAAKNEDKRWLCGREGVKADGTPAFICGARNPFDYWVRLDEHGEIVDSAMTKESLTAREPASTLAIEQRHYSGCPGFWSPNGTRRNLI